MIIYRFENKENKGPFRDFIYANHVITLLNSNDHPIPKNDGIYPNDGYGCYSYCILFGCLSFDDLKKWFDVYPADKKHLKDEDHVLFRELKYQINVYDCPDQYCQVGSSRKQVAFDITEATLIDTISIDKLYSEL